MPGRIIEIAEDGRSLHLDRGFLAIHAEGQCLGRVPLDDIDAVIASAQSISWSGNAIAALASRNAPVVMIGKDFAPVAYVIPAQGHHAQGRRAEAQASATLPVKKRLWAQLVRAKIKAQADALMLVGQPAERLLRLMREVKSGDTDNREALAAQVYWPLMMGGGFRRSQSQGGANAFLNYGYAVVRSAAARSIVAAGLNPALALHHKSDGDGLRLADDLMEPFRPAVDLVVRDLLRAETKELDPATKKRLVSVIWADVQTGNGRSPVSVAMTRLAQSLAMVFEGTAGKLDLPSSCLPLTATGSESPQEET